MRRGPENAFRVLKTVAAAVVVAATLTLSPAPAFADRIPENVQAEVLRLNERAIDAFQREDDAAAEAAFERAVHLLESGGWMDDPTAAQILDNLANLYRVTGRWTEAENAYRRVVGILERLFGKDDASIAPRLQTLGAMLQQQGRYQEASSDLGRALTIRRAVLPPDHPDIGESAYALGQVLQALGETRQAENLYREALRIWAGVFGEASAEVGTVANDLGHLYTTQGRYAEAEPVLRRSLAANRAALGPDHGEVGRSLNNLAALNQVQARYARAEDLYGQAIAIWEDALGPDDPLLAGAIGNLAQLYQTTGRYAPAEALFRHALGIYEKAYGSGHMLTGVGLGNLAFVLQLQGRIPEAEALMVRSLDVLENALGPDHPNITAGLTNLGLLYRGQGRLAEARPLLERALNIFERAKGADHLSVATALNNLADLLRAEGKDAEAEPLLLRTLEIQRGALSPTHPDVATTINNLGSLYYKLGRMDVAEARLRGAVDLFEQALGPDHPDLVIPLGNLIDIYQKAARYGEALDLSGRGLAILSARRARATEDRASRAETEFALSRPRFRRHLDILAHALADGAVSEESVVADGFQVAQQVVSGSVAQAMKRASARLAASDGALAALVRRRQDAGDDWRRTDAALLDALGRGDLDRADKLRARLDALDREIDAAEDALGDNFPDYLELVRPGALPVELVQPLLRDGESLLLYVLNAEDAHLWVVSRNRAAYRALPTDAGTVARSVGLIRESLEPDANGGIRAFPAAHAHALYRMLIAPAAGLLPKDESLLVVADGALQGLPFGLMLMEDPGTGRFGDDAELKRAAWLTRRHAVSVLPGVSSLRALRGERVGGDPVGGGPAGEGAAEEEKPWEPFKGFGDPMLEGGGDTRRGVTAAALFRDSGSRLANTVALRNLTRLPETAGELRRIAALLGAGEADLYLGPDATEASVKSADLSRTRVLSFATHGVVAGSFEAVGQPGLVLTPPVAATPQDDGLLTAGEVALLRLNAEAVILSACNTAAPDGTPGAEGLSGLAKAFLYAGAKSMLVSHWPVDSAATVTLMTGVFEARERAPEIGLAEALRRARLSMIDKGARPALAHPFYWSPFVLVGEGGGG